MIKVDNVQITISAEVSSYSSREPEPKAAGAWILTATIKSDSREFLEKVCQAMHQQLATPSISARRIIEDVLNKTKE